jgi:hypothetical protein
MVLTFQIRTGDEMRLDENAGPPSLISYTSGSAGHMIAKVITIGCAGRHGRGRMRRGGRFPIVPDARLLIVRQHGALRRDIWASSAKSLI